MTDDVSPQRPLPESLTRFLSDPVPKAQAPQARPLPRPRLRVDGARSSRPNRALSIVLAWALAYNVLGFAILALLWGSLR